MPESPDVARNSMRMKDGSYRSVASPSEVGNYLQLARRPFPDGREALTFSLRGLWHCTMTSDGFQEWSDRIALAVLEGHCVRQASKDGGDVFVEAIRARNAIGTSVSRRSVAVLALVEDALFELRVAEGVAEARASFDQAARTLASVAASAAGAARPAKAIEDEVASDGQVPDAEETDGIPGDPDLDRVRRFVPVSEREIGGRNVLSVIARDVYVFVGSARGFSHWFDDQRAGCRLTEGVDYVDGLLGKSAQKPARGRPPVEYVLTLDAAKEVGMVDKGPRGKELRQYFLECERRLASGEPALQSIAAVGPQLPAVVLADPSLVPRLSAETVPLSIRSYLSTKGFGRGGIGLQVADGLGCLLSFQAQKELVVSLVTAGDPACWFCRHPETGDLLFSRPALDAWWAAHEGEIVAASLGK